MPMCHANRNSPNDVIAAILLREPVMNDAASCGRNLRMTHVVPFTRTNITGKLLSHLSLCNAVKVQFCLKSSVISFYNFIINACASALCATAIMSV